MIYITRVYNMSQREKDKNKKLYRELITELKILYMRAEHNEEEEIKKRRYREAYKKLELIEERRHLTEIGKQGIHKEAYLTALETIGRRCEDTARTGEIIEEIIEDIEQLCEKFNIKDKDIKDEKIDDIEFEK